MRARVRWFVTATALLTFGAVPSSSAAVGVSVLPPAVGDAVSQFRRTFAPAEVPGLGADRLVSSARPLSQDGRAINVVTADGRRQVSGVPLRPTVPATDFPIFVADGSGSIAWTKELVAKLEGTVSFNSELAFYYLQDGGGPLDFTTGLRTFDGERGNGDPRHTGCQLAKLWDGSGFRVGGEWRTFRNGQSFDENCLLPRPPAPPAP